jgi:lipopolysaccharide/colanic/teichoic acid biosynthesis glycosyltransferase
MKTQLSPAENIFKRALDLLLSLLLLTLTWWLILLGWIIASIDTRSNGLFRQTRIGRYGKPFTIYKLKTMQPLSGYSTTVTASSDPRITLIGRWLRRMKMDELPQFFNVLIGDMSFVGPRPDVPGFADHLQGEDRMVLNLRPGITGPATLAFRQEEEILAEQSDPETYNREIIFPEKIRINKDYIQQYSLRKDLWYIVLTAVGR